jgi:capsular polysaccharide biosynthesis protein
MRAAIATNPAWLSPRPPYTPFAATVPDARVVSPLFTVFTRDGAAIKESLYLTSVEKAVSHLNRGRERVPETATVYLIANKNYGHYYHWTTQCLAALALITTGVLRAEGRLLTGPLADWQQRLLELVGFDKSRLEILESGSVATFERLVFPSLLTRRDPIVWPGMIPLYAAIKAAADRRHEFGERLYISREDARDRPLQNEEELAARLAEFGFRTITSGRLSVDEQISAFAGAKIIVAPHGAGLANVVYCEPGTILYELHPSHYVKSCYYWLSQLFRLRYWADCFPALDAGQATKEARHKVHWMVDIPVVLNRVEMILSRG